MQKGLFGAAYKPVVTRKPGRPPRQACIPDTAGGVSPPAGAVASPSAEVVVSSDSAPSAGPIVSTEQPAAHQPLVKKTTKQSIKQQEKRQRKRKTMREEINKLKEQVSLLMQERSERQGQPLPKQDEPKDEVGDGPKHGTREYFQRCGSFGGRKRERSFHARMPHTATPCKHLKQPPISAKVALGRYMRKVVKQEFAGEATEQFWAGMESDTGKPHPWLLSVYENLEKLDAERKHLNLGMAMQSTRIKIGVSKARALGKRAKGAGRKNWLLPIWRGVKQWFLQQRENGCFVDKPDLFLELSERAHLFADKLEAYRAQGKPLPRVDHSALRAAKQFIKSTDPEAKHTEKNKQNRVHRLMQFIGCRLCKPQRLVDLSKDEEMHRLHQTWRLIDERLSLCAFGTTQELSGHVGDPASFIEHRKQCVVLQSDQMPVYALLKPSQQLYAAHERRKAGQKSGLSDEQKKGKLSGGHGQGSMHPLDELEEAKPGALTQKRGTDHAGQDKHRVTVELVHAIFHWFDSSKRPISKQGKHLLVMSGQHADVSNISDDHRFIETKRFWVGGKPIEHIAGDKTNLFINLVKLRKEEPSVQEMCSKLHIMQQPSGFVDQTIQAWHTEHQSKQYPISICIRDLFTGAYCDKSRLGFAISQQLVSWIWGKMTPVCQLTDTTAARPFKQFLQRLQVELRQELRSKHQEEGTEVSFKCGHYELLKLISQAMDKLDDYMDGDKQRTIRDSVANGLLAYRPNLTTGKLEITVEQQWAKDMDLKLGNHRMEEHWFTWW